EDERDLASADALESPRREREQVGAVEERAAGDRRRLGQQAYERHARHALPASRLADDAEHLTLVERESHPVHRVHRAVVGVEADREIGDLEQRHQRVVRGSKMSRRPSPSTLNASAATTIARPGYTASRGACERYDCASWSIVPHDGAGGCTPSPRNERTASPTIASGIVTVACTSSVLVMFGRMCLKMIVASLAPFAIAAGT